MSERRTQNSILFLTTLGVYLGLVLVGATPVLGHAATTRNFELLDEIEFKDDLDTNPDDCSNLRLKAEDRTFAYGGRSDALSDYAKIIGSLARTLQASRLNAYSFNSDAYPTSNSEPFVSFNGHSKPILLPGGFRPQIDSQLARLPGLVPGAGSTKEVVLSFDLEWTDSGLASTTTFARANDVDAYRLFVSLNAGLDLWRCSSTGLSKGILRNTQVQGKNDQVTVVTRLPRAALISLLSNDAK
ncbi:MAG: hypothetical protein AB7Q37_09635 [Pyrinomonadaceae bacterium]